jgi:hypothetical protein
VIADKRDKDDFLKERDLTNAGSQLSRLVAIQTVLREMHYVLLHFFFIEIGALVNLHSLFLIVLFHLSHDDAHFRISQTSFFGN